VDRAPGLVVRGLVKWIERATAGYLRSLRAIPTSDRIDVTYEALCRDPSSSVTRILSHLDLDAAIQEYSQKASPRTLSVAKPIVHRRDLIVRRLRTYADSVGYDLPALAAEL
jgi:hypothetical protein